MSAPEQEQRGRAVHLGQGPGQVKEQVPSVDAAVLDGQPDRVAELSGQGYAIAGGLVVDVFEKSHPARCCGGGDGVGLGAAAVTATRSVACAVVARRSSKSAAARGW